MVQRCIGCRLKGFAMPFRLHSGNSFPDSFLFSTMRLIVFLFTVCLSLSCTGNSNNASAPNTNAVRNTNSTQTSGPLPVYTYEVVKTYPHDPKAFTEGLFYNDGFLYESTGETGKSSL